MMEKDDILVWIFIVSVIAAGTGTAELFDSYIKMNIEVAKIQAGCKP